MPVGQAVTAMMLAMCVSLFRRSLREP